MFLPIATAPTCATAWLAATKCLIEAGDEAYNLVVDIDDPTNHPPADAAVIVGLDRFLRAHKANPVATVTNTIFPQDLYRRCGAAALRDEYLKTYDAIKVPGWGRYFERMVRWPPDGSDQLHNLINRLRDQIATGRPFHNVYELALYNPPTDAKRNRGRQCLSFLSFKLHPRRGLLLTALYRNHHYITRALGNFIGLGYLMEYIAAQAGTTVGSLTCISTHAQIDAASKSSKECEEDDKVSPWTIREARSLIADLSNAHACPPPAAEPAASPSTIKS